MPELILIAMIAVAIALVYLYTRVPQSKFDRIERDTDYNDNERQLDRAFSRIGELENRVAHLEDPTGKRKRGYAIYDFYPGIPGLKALADYEPPQVEVKSDDEATARFAYSKEHESYIYLGDDGELKSEKENSDGSTAL